jgi:sRNA-binding protein
MGLWDKIKQGAKKTGEKLGEASRQYEENKVLKAERMKERKKAEYKARQEELKYLKQERQILSEKQKLSKLREKNKPNQPSMPMFGSGVPSMFGADDEKKKTPRIW